MQERTPFGAVPPDCWRVFDDVQRVALGVLSEARGLLPMWFRLEGGKTIRGYASDLPRVYGVRDVRDAANRSVGSAVAFVWDRDPDGMTDALAIELRLKGMGAPIRYLQRYRLPEKGQAAAALGPPILVGDCTWGRHGEDEPSFPPLRCPVCAAEMLDDTPRYPKRVCGTCVGMARSADGRSLRFGNQGMGGFVATFADTGKVYPSHECFIAGVRCEANEAHFGGIVVEAGPAWLVYRDADGMHSILLRGPNVLTIGRDPKCDIAVKDLGLTSRHARIRVALDGSLTLTDLNSKGGSQVNGRLIVEAPASAGDTFRLGTVDFAIVAAPLRKNSVYVRGTNAS
jgi:Inner membrane component of T3SS, cytoplasmic domain